MSSKHSPIASLLVLSFRTQRTQTARRPPDWRTVSSAGGQADERLIPDPCSLIPVLKKLLTSKPTVYIFMSAIHKWADCQVRQCALSCRFPHHIELRLIR